MTCSLATATAMSAYHTMLSTRGQHCHSDEDTIVAIKEDISDAWTAVIKEMDTSLTRKTKRILKMSITTDKQNLHTVIYVNGYSQVEFSSRFLKVFTVSQKYLLLLKKMLLAEKYT